VRGERLRRVLSADRGSYDALCQLAAPGARCVIKDRVIRFAPSPYCGKAALPQHSVVEFCRAVVGATAPICISRCMDVIKVTRICPASAAIVSVVQKELVESEDFYHNFIQLQRNIFNIISTYCVMHVSYSQGKICISIKIEYIDLNCFSIS
jgi:hypothetical protein